MIEKLLNVYLIAAGDTIIRLVIISTVFDTVFGCLQAALEKKLNSAVGINGVIRKAGMLLSLGFFVLVDALVEINLIGFIPVEARDALGLGFIGLTQFFGILYIAYESISICKHMVLCGLPVRKVSSMIRNFLKQYTDELPADIPPEGGDREDDYNS